MFIKELPPPPRTIRNFGVPPLPFDRRALSRRGAVLGALLTIALTLVPASGAVAQQQHSLPLVKPAGSTQQGFLRIVNRSDRAGTVHIHAIDDDGDRFGPVTLSLGSMATAHLNSTDLEDGNASKGLSGGVGNGGGDWRLELTTDLDIEPLAYIRTPDGFVTSVHDVVQPEVVRGATAAGDVLRYHVRFLNPGKNANQQSLLRLINSSGAENVVTITGLDDRGNAPPGGDVVITMAPHTARTITARELEQGDDDFDGSFGAGSGKWQLFVTARGTLHGYNRPIQVVSLLNSTGTGNLTNLSTTGAGNSPNRGGDGMDFITGGAGDDVLNPGDNDDAYDAVFGSAGNDRIVYSDSGPSAYQSLDYSSLSTGIRATINGVSNAATVNKGAAGTDTIVDIVKPLDAAREPPYGGFGISGSSSDDTFVLTLDAGQWMEVRGNAGSDRIDIRSGSVQINYRSSTQGINVDLATGRVSNDGFGGVDTIIGDVRELIGGDGNDTLLGSNGDDRFEGRAGDDTINPKSNTRGNDNVYASVGNDRIIYSDSGANAYQALWYSRPWRDSLTPLDEVGIQVTIDGATSSATVRKGSAGTDTIVDINNPLTGWGFGLHGTKTDDRFDLTLDHGQWMQVEGGQGNDTFNLQTQPWESNARPGSSIRIDYRNSANGIDIDLRDRRARNDGFGNVDTFTLNDGSFHIRGSDFTDTIRGSDNDESFIGRRGNDIIDGRGGFDQLRFDRECCATILALTVDLYGGTATGVWNGESFSYKVSNIERVRGTNNDDELIGSNGDDRLEGRGGDDTIDGYGGDDRLYGGDGRDTFLFDRGDGHDRIYDFADGEDLIVLTDLGITSKDQVLNKAFAWEEGTGVHIDLTSFGGGRIDLHGFNRDHFDASDFQL